ncbi:MAG TPA: hypothetical protein VE130_02430 [Nitrososphaeraceae archaeon]|nr:hypothetical protein [Nitrososphaeraceae archaeon]
MTSLFDFSLSDIAAIAALGFSGYTFLVGSRRWSRSKKSEEIKTARELMDRITIKDDRLDEYKELVEKDPASYDFGKHLDLMNDVLLEIQYYGLLIKNDVIEESELLKHDRHEVYEIWRTINLAGKDIQNKIRKEGLTNTYRRRIKKHNELLASITKYRGPKGQEVT